MNRLALLCAAIALASGCGVDEIAQIAPPQPKVRKVLIVGWDGARSDAVQTADTPVLDKLAAQGAYSYAASTQTKADTFSSPGWLSILTGVQPDKHRVDSNLDFNEHDKKYPSFLKRAKFDLGLKTAAACDWEILCGLILKAEHSYDSDKMGSEEAVTLAMEKWLLKEDHAVHFIHLDLPDHAGHATGFDPNNPEYMDAIEQSDKLTGRLVEAIAKRPNRAQEEWLIGVVTDHGGEGREHGPRNAINQTIFIVLAGNGVIQGELPAGITQMDVHPTVMHYLGARVEPAWKLDGHVIGLNIK